MNTRDPKLLPNASEFEQRQHAKGIMESNRKLHVQGMSLTPKNAFQETSTLWKIDELPIDKLVEGIERWEGKLDEVQEQQGYEMVEDDKLQALLMMTPSTLKSKLLEDRGRGMLNTYEELKE